MLYISPNDNDLYRLIDFDANSSLLESVTNNSRIRVSHQYFDVWKVSV